MSFDTNMCFTCLKGNGVKLQPITETDLDSISYLQKLITCIPNVIQNDRMVICNTCIKYLRMSYKFREIVLRSQETWGTYSESCQQIINSVITENDVEVIVNSFDLPEAREVPNEQLLLENSVSQTSINTDIVAATFTHNIDSIDCIKMESSKQSTSDSLMLDDDIDSSDNKIFQINFNDEFSDNSCFKSINPPKTEFQEDDLKIKEEKLNPIFDSELTEDTKDDLPLYKCDKCKVLFNNEEKLSAHSCPIKKDPKQVCCDICMTVFNKVWKYNRHMKKNHTNERNYTCTYCSKSFKQSYHLREHMTIHTGEKKFTCPVCDKKFKRASSQRRHIKSHSAVGIKTKKTPYLCTICGKSFPYSNGAQRHMRTHTGEKKFECTVCERKFSQTTHLHIHMRIHTGEKPYVCDSCGEAFSLKPSLLKHLKTHEIKPEPPVPGNLEEKISDYFIVVGKP